MTTTIIKNPLGQHTAVIRFDSTSTIQASQLANGSETVTGFDITKILCSTSGNVSFARGANTLLTIYAGSVDWDLSAHGIKMSEYNAANLVITVTTGGSGFVEVVKYTTPFLT